MLRRLALLIGILASYVGEMFDLILHPQGGNTSSSAPRLTTFRLGARIGF